MRRLAAAALLAALAAPAAVRAAPAPAPVAPAGPPVDPDLDRLRPLYYAILACRARGDLGKCHAQLVDRAQGATDPAAKLLAFWSNTDEEAGWSDLNRLARENPNYGWPHLAMASFYDRWKVRDQAQKELEKAVELSPGLQGIAAAFRCELHRHAEDFTAAVADADEALRFADRDALAMMCGGLARRALKDTGSARQLLEKATALQGDLAEAQRALAQLYDEAGDRDQAAQRYEKVVKLTPKDRDAHVALGRLREAQGDLAGAAGEDEEAAKLGAVDPELQGRITGLYQKLGRVEDEIAALQRLAKMKPKDADIWRRLAQIHHERADTVAENDDLHAVVNRDPGDVAAWLRIAALARERDEYKDEMEALQNALRAEPKNAVAQEKLAALRSRLDIADPPIDGNGDVNKVYKQVFKSLDKFYAVRRKELPKLRGSLKLKVSVGEDGRCMRVEITEDQVNDAMLLNNVYWNLKFATYPKATKSYNFAFDLKPASKG